MSSIAPINCAASSELPSEAPSPPPGAGPSYSLGSMCLYFLKLGTLGFGGPVALVGFMHRDLVEDRKWITDDDYKDGLALAQVAPGPLAAQLARNTAIVRASRHLSMA
ncbi:MAG: chromate transporter [Gemmataceae bacterium]|nr:chromate transporter [Gemmataceae bacterium]